MPKCFMIKGRLVLTYGSEQANLLLMMSYYFVFAKAVVVELQLLLSMNQLRAKRPDQEIASMKSGWWYWMKRVQRPQLCSIAGMRDG